MRSLESRLSRLLKRDPYLTPFSDQIRRRLQRIEETKQRLTQGKMSLAGFAFNETNGFFMNGHQTRQRFS